MGLYKLAYRFKCGRFGQRARRTPIACLYERDLPALTSPFNELPFLVVDCEMSGLCANTNRLLSMGWVKIQQGMIDYASRQHILVHSEQSVGESVLIHGLQDSRIAGAASPSHALSLFARLASQSVVVFHHATLDIQFLQRASQAAFSCPLSFPFIDTMMIEQRRLTRQGKTASLQLNLCRDRYGLPPAFAHNAMHDAVATAELLLAQCAYMKGSQQLELKSLGLRLV